MSTSIQIVRTVVDGAIGEVTVTFDNSGEPQRDNVVITIEDGGPVSPNADGHLVYIPGAVEGGFAVGQVAADTIVVRSFAVKPVDAEAGKTYQATATVAFDGGQEEAHADVFVEARPEVYAAVGAAEALRAQLLEFYNNAKEHGRAVHENTALPETKGDPTSRALQPSSFQWAMQMVELGTKMFRFGGPPRGSGDQEQD